MYRRFLVFLFLLAVFSQKALPQAWSTFLDSSRAVDWTSAGFTIPNYTTNCTVQPTLTANSSSAASANTTAIQSALNSCDATHNVVNIPAGTYYVTGLTYGSQGKQVLRGAGTMSTTIIPTTEAGCGGLNAGLCMINGSPTYNGSPTVMPGGSQQCSWTAGYARGTTTITLSGCGTAPSVNQSITLDQANDTSDTGGIYICDTNIANCGYEGSSGGNNDGRFINGVTHSQQQVTSVTGVTALGGGSYSVTISPGIYFTNIRSSQSPGAWWVSLSQNDGLENISIDGSNIGDYNISIDSCYQCWVKNVRSINAARGHVLVWQGLNDVVRDSYFFESQSHASDSYAVEIEWGTSQLLVENNIFQQVTFPVMFGQGSGSVISYNLGIDDVYTASASFLMGADASHNAGSEMNLWEGNVFTGIMADDAWGSSDQSTLFRNMLSGWQSGKSQLTIPVLMRSLVRAYNVIGNVLGQPGYHTQYQTYATASQAGTGSAAENTSIYSLGWSNTGAACGTPTCDSLVFSTLMRWGNYDTVTAGVKWDTTEASPAGVPYVNANFTSSLFSSLAHTLPASLHYSSKPSWWPTTKPWPAVGPDVSSGNLGVCSGGSYAGAQATSSSQCTGGSLSSAWSGHANSIPTQDCYLNTMHGAPDGTGSVLNFDANQCYAASSQTPGPPSPPTGLVGTVN